MFFNTFVFQAGLVNLLFHKFKGTILLSAAYLALSISFHVWVMVGRGGLGAASFSHLLRWPQPPAPFSPSPMRGSPHSTTTGTLSVAPPCDSLCNLAAGSRLEGSYPIPAPALRVMTCWKILFSQGKPSSSSSVLPQKPALG